MGVCEPGQGGNAAAISNTFMCLGEPPRLSPAPVSEARGRGSENLARPGVGEETRAAGWRTNGVIGVGSDSGTPHLPRHDGARRVAPPRGSKDRTSSPDPAPDLGGDGQPVRSATESYTVVARRYRPQRFEDVVGQDHVVRALRNAIRLNRIAQAYLFCGTRGVGKTTMARIFAKCLNCVKGPTEEPCQVCDICQAIASGQDVDVIEIDGASNNGVEQVRELRQNAGTAAQPGAVQDLLHRRSPHALDRGLQRAVEDPGRAAAARQVLLRDDRGEQDPDHGALAVPAVRPGRNHARRDRQDPGRDLRRRKEWPPSPRPCKSSPAARPDRCATHSRCWTGSWPPAALG